MNMRGCGHGELFVGQLENPFVVSKYAGQMLIDLW